MNNDKQIKPLFGIWCQKILPLVYDESLSYYEKLCKILQKLNEVIESQNNLQNEFYQLKDWVNSQLEIYSKKQLQEWLNDGTLENIIAKLVLTYHIYSNHNEMVNDSDLKDGDFAQTINFSNPLDLGGSIYSISSQNNDLFSYKLNNGLYANLISSNKMNAHQFGIFGDNSTDVTDLLNNAIKFVSTLGDSYLFIPKGNYMIQCADTSAIPNPNTYLRDNGGIKLLNGMRLMLDDEAIMKTIPTNHQAYVLFRIYNVQDIEINGGQLIGDLDSHFGTYGGEWGYGIAVTASSNIRIRNVKISKMWGDGVNLQYGTINEILTNNTDVIIDNVECDSNRRQGLSLENGINVIIKNSIFMNTSGTLPESGIDIEPSNDNSIVENVVIDNCIFRDNANRNITSTNTHSNYYFKKVSIKNCSFYDCGSPDKYNVVLTGFNDIIMDNNQFFSENSRILLLTGNKQVNIINSFLNNVIFDINTNDYVIISNCVISHNQKDYNLISSEAPLMISNCILKVYNHFIYSNNDCTMINNIIIGLESSSMTNVIQQGENGLFIANQNILKGQLNNLLDNNNPPKQYKISQGGISCLSLGSNKPVGFKGDIGIYNGKIVYYNGSTWVNYDGSAI